MALKESDGETVEQAGAQFGADRPSPVTVSRNSRYRMSAGWAAQGDDFPILNDAAEPIYCLSGQALSENDTIQIENTRGAVICSALVRAARKHERIAIVDSAGRVIGSVVRQPVSPLRDRFFLDVHDGTVLAVDGNVATHEFSIVGPSGSVAEVSQRWFRARGSYGVEIEPDQNDALLLIAVLVLDQMIHATT